MFGAAYLKGFQTSKAGIQLISELKTFWANLADPEFDKAEQAKIAEVLSTVDRAIEETEALIAKQQRIKTGLMQDLLIRGIDEHGNLRSEQTHKFKDSPLGRIPVEWESAMPWKCLFLRPVSSAAELPPRPSGDSGANRVIPWVCA